MRLLNVKTRCLEEYFNEIPEYATLSHTWGTGEVTFQDLQSGVYDHLAGFSKVDNCCRVAQDAGVNYVWIDTCCIDKSNSSELQEAINSMFKWYQSSSVCYVYLADVAMGETMSNPGPSIAQSRWFTRGWTLQELLAPRYHSFYNQNWDWIGSLSPGDTDTAKVIGGITGIDFWCLLKDSSIQKASIAERMSWAAHRSTTREEDMAYCLLGIFDVNIPLLYGEGEKAFLRLQEEIIRRSDDETIFSWHYGFPIGECPHGGLYARSPRCFAQCGTLVQGHTVGAEQKHYSLTNKGLYIKPSLYRFGTSETCLIILNCTQADKLYSWPRRLLAVPVVTHAGGETHSKGTQYWRPEGSVPFFMDWARLADPSLKQLYLRYEESNDYPYTTYVDLQNLESLPVRLTYVYPPHSLAVKRQKPPEAARETLDEGTKKEFHLVLQSMPDGKSFLLKIAFEYGMRALGHYRPAFYPHVSYTILGDARDIERFRYYPLDFIRSVMQWESGALVINGRYVKVNFQLAEHLLVKFPVLSFEEMY